MIRCRNQNRRMTTWPRDADALVAVQLTLAAAEPEPWDPPAAGFLVGGCFAAFPRGLTGPGAAGDPVWAAAAVMDGRRLVSWHVELTEATASYLPGLLALREGPALEAAVRGLSVRPDVLLVNATGRDHPRGAGLALHLGAVLGLPTVGVTHRQLVSAGDWVQTRSGTRPLAVDAAWRTSPDTAVHVVRTATGASRTPEPIRQARRLAREARAHDAGAENPLPRRPSAP